MQDTFDESYGENATQPQVPQAPAPQPEAQPEPQPQPEPEAPAEPAAPLDANGNPPAPEYHHPGNVAV